MLSTKDDAMSQAIEHLRARVEAQGGTLTATREGRDCYHLAASLPEDGQRETLILRWDPDRQEPTFFFQGREYILPEAALTNGKLSLLPPGWREKALGWCDCRGCEQPAVFVHALNQARWRLRLCPAHQTEIDQFQQHCRSAGDPEPVVRERLLAAFPFWRTEKEESDA